MDNNLLSITSVPISIEVNIVKGRLENPRTAPPQIEISTKQGDLQIEAKPARINIDTYAARSSLGYGNLNYSDFNKKEASKGISIAYEATAKIVNDGNALVRGSSPSEIAIRNKRAGATIQTIMEHLPKEGADITYDKGRLNINYEMPDVNIDWSNLETEALRFRPGTIEFIVKEKPRIEIEYMGEPIYFPVSMNADYKPPQTVLDKNV